MIDPFETLLAEVEYGISILRPHYPDQDDDWLEKRAMAMRPKHYETGRRPTDDELAAQKVAEEAAAKAEGERAARFAAHVAERLERYARYDREASERAEIGLNSLEAD
jgi:hypothetical protein